jgi:hypothetical protein
MDAVVSRVTRRGSADPEEGVCVEALRVPVEAEAPVLVLGLGLGPVPTR